MALKIGPYTVTRGALLPYSMSGVTTQSVDEALDGSVVVVDAPYVARIFEATIQVPVNEAEDILGFIVNGARFSAVPFVVVDGYGTARLVRWWGGREIEQRLIASGIVEMTLKFREEVPA